ncbi:MAG: tetratricopeptide repeat protein [Candidatus Amulumruptor caecigallinarius]|nr:tetratricopeptide repeat protein [Candidatus Amulumruptor caecigallinarius]
MKRATTYLLSSVILAGVLACFASGRNDTGSGAARSKARYMYTQGLAAAAAGDESSAYEFYKRAFMCDPSYEVAGYAYGSRRLMIGIDTLQSDAELQKSLDMMRPYVDEYPDDEFEAIYYSYVAGRLGKPDEGVRVLERTYALHPENSNTLLQLSDIYLRRNDLKSAVDALTRYESAEGMSSQLTMRKSSYMLADGDTAGALNAADRLIASDPLNDEYHVLKGSLLEMVNKKDSALIYYQQAEMLNPEGSGPKLALAGFYQEMGDSVAYDGKMYEVLLSEDLESDEKIGMLAQYLQSLFSDNHETKRGDHLFEVLIHQYPHDPRVLDLAGRYSAAKGDFKNAVEQISYAIDLDGSNTAFWGQLMAYQTVGGNPEKALETYRRAIKHIVPDENMTLYYASVAQMSKQYGLAADVFRSLIAKIDSGLNPDSLVSLNDVRRDISMEELDKLSSLFTSLGDNYHLAGEDEKGYRAFENAITLNDNNAMARNNYAYFLSLAGGDLDKALILSQGSLAGDDAQNPTYLDTYAWILHLKGDNESALRYLRAAVEKMEASEFLSAELYDHLGDVLKDTGDAVGAAEAYEKAVELQKKNGETEEESYKNTLKKLENIEKREPKKHQ